MVGNSVSWSNTTEAVNAAPPMPDPATVEALPGTWMFAGIAYGHFGHFIVESMSRIWALGELAGKLDGIIFTPKIVGPNVERIVQVYTPLMQAMGVSVPARSTAVPLQVQRLYVPRQGFGMMDLIEGSEKFRRFITENAGRDIAPKGPERIYISRSKLPAMRGGLIGEAVLEELLIGEGYAIYHPQKETQADQIAQYKAARDIISVDCSPLHLVGYVGDSAQRVGILTRRSMAIAESMVRQIRTFTGADAFEVNALVRDWVPGNAHRAGRSSYGEIDLPRTYAALKAKGMIASDVPWPALTDEQREADVARISDLHAVRFKPLGENAQPSPAPTAPTSS
ncbi:glycosyltransferase 61 family protein [Paracoccus luteus]|uniref:glycosyltransferase 61 family protein n=1 Tax=Paracoccus luteus TaxID=2508543 RepID=UPI00106FEBB7|nr:glycosyltransferase 61 family protein [Paracoccus luteus]